MPPTFTLDAAPVKYDTGNEVVPEGILLGADGVLLGCIGMVRAFSRWCVVRRSRRSNNIDGAKFARRGLHRVGLGRGVDTRRAYGHR